MITVFSTTKDYVRFLSALPDVPGSASCLTYLPSSLFPKDALTTFFSRKAPVAQPDIVAGDLWRTGKQRRRSLQARRDRVIVDSRALQAFCRRGLVHEATPEFEITFTVRAAVLRQLRDLVSVDVLRVTPAIVPYVYRIVPPAGVLLDVERNVPEQLVQGIWLEDQACCEAFTREFERAWQLAGDGASLDARLARVDAAIAATLDGRSEDW